MEQKENYIEHGLNRLITQYKNSKNLKKLLTVFLEDKQGLENEIQSLYERLDIDNKTGFELDQVGKLVGQERLGFADDIYKVLIYSRIAINSSGGTPENIINLFKILMGTEGVQYRELYPASIQIWCKGSLPYLKEILIPYIVNALQTILPAGVGLNHVGVYDEDSPFTFAEEDGLISLDGKDGFDDENDLSIGGSLGEEIYIGGAL
ncbi:MAG: DUF2612 domain-containing protein [bacterium]|nr:DUF2612 domain-containing protein [bacterium]